MAKQVHFVIAVDVDNQTIFIDDDTYTAKFDRAEQVWDSEAEHWLGDDDGSYYQSALTILNNKAQIERE